MIAKGTELTFTITGTVSESFGSSQWSPADLRNDVMRALTLAEVVSFRIEGDATWQMETWSYKAVVTVRTLYDHRSMADVISIIDGAFWTAAGTRPIVTEGADTQDTPTVSKPGATSTLSLIAIIIVGALVLIIWAKP